MIVESILQLHERGTLVIRTFSDSRARASAMGMPDWLRELYLDDGDIGLVGFVELTGLDQVGLQLFLFNLNMVLSGGCEIVGCLG